ncbi:MAG: trypsin-like peptidase domain-containing protein [Chloroflexi bacterium]|nr:trypsin-like peptidase domain-containing protein [Chloroflexota bacterium]
MDQAGTAVGEAQVTWSILDSNVGSLSGSGLFTAGEVAGNFKDSLEVQATEGGLTATASITIVPGPLNQVGIAPESLEIGMGMTQQFVAAGADEFGNRISGLKFEWSVEAGGGAIDADAIFTAGSDPGTYAETMRAAVTQGDTTISTTTGVTVEADRIAFLSRRDAEKLTDTPNLYIMNVDGSNVIQITRGGALDPSWSPHGRRIVYDRRGRLYAVNDDGDWRVTVLSERFRADDPVWSPDGTKIVFQSFEHAIDDNDNAGSEIYVMDVDGGNRIRLTDNSYRDDKPSWSPDGSKITFISDSEGDAKEQIYVIDSDGSNLRRVTNGGDHSNPKWSPDGSQLVFEFRPSSRDWWRLGIIDAVVTLGGGRQINIPGGGDYSPTWSQDGERILFYSYRDSEYYKKWNRLTPAEEKSTENWAKGAEVYIMDRSGRNVRRLTNNDAWDGVPVWAPRKAGVEVSDASIVFRNASSLMPMTVRDVTSSARPAVVRIKTDRGSGSGFIIDPQGLILTNNHVIRDAQEITVFLEDGTEHVGTVQGRELIRDLAVVKIEASNLPILELGDLSNVNQGQQVVVLGYPLGKTDLSITSGFVSTTAFDPGRNMWFIQTDSAINPGNSGGPLLDLQGQVIGVVSAKFVSVSVEGIGLAISANTVNLYLDRLEEREVVKSDKAPQAGVNRGGTLLRSVSSNSIAVDGARNVFVADAGNHRVQRFGAGGAFVVTWGTPGSGSGQFNSPAGVAVNGNQVYIVDAGNHRVQSFLGYGQFGLKWGALGNQEAQFKSPEGIAVGKNGIVYVADTGNHRVQKFFSYGGFAGEWGSQGSGKGQFNSPSAIATDEKGNVYVVDKGNHRVQKFTANGLFLATWGNEGSGDGQFKSPGGIAVSGSSVYVTDKGNHRVQTFTTDGRFMFNWGSQGRQNGQFNSPVGIAADGVGSVYVTDTGNYRVQRFTTGGVYMFKWGSQGSQDGQFR